MVHSLLNDAVSTSTARITGAGVTYVFVSFRSALGGDTADVSEVYPASKIRVDTCEVGELMYMKVGLKAAGEDGKAECAFVTSAKSPRSIRCNIPQDKLT
jgi:hypothetical protein